MGIERNGPVEDCKYLIANIRLHGTFLSNCIRLCLRTFSLHATVFALTRKIQFDVGSGEFSKEIDDKWLAVTKRENSEREGFKQQREKIRYKRKES